MMGLEEHLLTMFRGDFEFHDDAPASHLGSTGAVRRSAAQVAPDAVAAAAASAEAGGATSKSRDTAVAAAWAPEAEKELGKIPFFVRGKARRNTERFAAERSVELITVETLYDAKAHYSR
jgi:light-independent protochlorophyllide reductase subunit B